MEKQYPRTIENKHGEKIIFHGKEMTSEGERIINEGFCKPGAGPAMHVHFKQEEGFTVLEGKMGYEILGRGVRYAFPGEQVEFKRGTPHRFWAEGNETLHIKGWLQPANNVEYFLTALYAAMNKSDTERPEMFDAAFLTTRYASEFEMIGLPMPVKKVIIPLTYYLGKLLGKYEHFKDAPEPVK